MTLVDTNVILRWLRDDHPRLSADAVKIVEAARQASLIITDVVVGEVVYILRSFGSDCRQTMEAIAYVKREPAFKFENEEVISETMQLHAETRLDYADCYLLTRALREKHDLVTFDKAMNRILESR